MHSLWFIFFVIVVVLSLCNVCCCVSASRSGGLTGGLRGGFGVKAPIDNLQLSWGSRDITWQISIEGAFVLFGTSSGFIPAMGMGLAHSSLFPPAIGFGSVLVTLTIRAEGTIIETHERSGFMVGPFVILT